MNYRTMGRAFLLCVVAFTILAAMRCVPNVEGTYSDANGAFVLELRSGGKASFTMMGETKPCSYTVSGNQITLECEGEKMVLTKHDDDSLTGPPEGTMPALRKTK
jgi:hypothetical protein